MYIIYIPTGSTGSQAAGISAVLSFGGTYQHVQKQHVSQRRIS